MKSQTEKNLNKARKQLGKCAAKVSGRKATSGVLSASEKEMLLGFGTARDWVRWAGALKDLSFSTKSEKKSARAQGITESVRFNQMWTATNALFAKEPILMLALSPDPLTAQIANSEFRQFEVLYGFAGLDAKLEKNCVDNLNALLSIECQTDNLTGELKADGTPTMWEVIYWKYMRQQDRKRPMGRIISAALRRAQIENVKAGSNRCDQPHPVATGPALIYAARNWAVHGMLLTSFFRGTRQKYTSFIDSITLLLSAVLRGSAKNLLAKL